MNPQLTTRLRHLRLSGMVEALPGRVAQARPPRSRISSFSNCSWRTSSPDAPIGSSRGG